MAISRGLRIGLYILAALVLLVVLTPFIVDPMVRSRIDAKLKGELPGSSYESLVVHFTPMGATIKGLKILNTESTGATQDLVRIDTIDALITTETIFGEGLHLKSMDMTGVHVNIKVDEKGESSFAKYVREKPPSPRKVPLPIDALKLEDVTISTFVAAKLSGAKLKEGSADSVLKVPVVHATGLILPPPGKLLESENWVSVTIDKVETTTPALEGEDAAPCIKVGKTTFELAQAVSFDTPVRLRHFVAEQAEGLTIYTTPGRKPAITRAVLSIQQGFGVKEPAAIHESGTKPETPKGMGLLIDDLKISGGRIETRGVAAGGQPAYWRLNAVNVDGKNLAFGANLKPTTSGYLKIQSSTESSSGPGNLTFALTDLQGGYPNWSFKCDYHLENVAAAVFSVIAEEKDHTGVRSGTLSTGFSGSATNGQLNLQGSVTFSPDFEISSTAEKNFAMKLTRGEPISPITITGTIENPKISMPNQLAFLQNMLGSALIGAPAVMLETVFADTPLAPVMQEAAKVTKEATGVLQKIPIVGKLFGDDKKKD